MRLVEPDFAGRLNGFTLLFEAVHPDADAPGATGASAWPLTPMPGARCLSPRGETSRPLNNWRYTWTSLAVHLRTSPWQASIGRPPSSPALPSVIQRYPALSSMCPTRASPLTSFTSSATPVRPWTRCAESSSVPTNPSKACVGSCSRPRPSSSLRRRPTHVPPSALIISMCAMPASSNGSPYGANPRRA